MFTKHTKTKYAYVYMPQPLACFGTDNKFTAEHIVLRWQTIVIECKKGKSLLVVMETHD